jgi:transcriptional regulator with XRE-family HTH domain
MEIALMTALDHRRAAGDRLRRGILAAGLRYVQAAEVMDLSKSHLGNMMRGEGPIDAYKLYRLCRITGLTADWVLLDDPSGLPQRIATRLLKPAREPEQVD